MGFVILIVYLKGYKTKTIMCACAFFRLPQTMIVSLAKYTFTAPPIGTRSDPHHWIICRSCACSASDVKVATSRRQGQAWDASPCGKEAHQTRRNRVFTTQDGSDNYTRNSAKMIMDSYRGNRGVVRLYTQLGVGADGMPKNCFRAN